MTFSELMACTILVVGWMICIGFCVLALLQKVGKRYDPIDDEAKEFSQSDFVETAVNELRDWAKQNPMPDDQRTWYAWWAQFRNYMSW